MFAHSSPENACAGGGPPATHAATPRVASAAAMVFIGESPAPSCRNTSHGPTRNGDGKSVLLVGQTLRCFPPITGTVPTRPSQNDPDRVAAWELYRHEVGGRIRALRAERGLTQEALALRSGVTRNVLIAVEHGRRGLLYERLFDIADALDVPAGRLLGESPPG